MVSVAVPRLGVLVSGRGSNLQSIIDATRSGALAARVVAVISDRGSAQGLGRAQQAGIDAIHLDPRGFRDRDAYDSAIAAELERRHTDWICLAGYMRLIGQPLLEAFPQRILNIHPSLLPSFPGLDAQRQALAHGVKVSGATVHFVTSELDGGPIVLQVCVRVNKDDSVETLSDRILAEEHTLYPQAIRTVLERPWRIEGRRFVLMS